MSKRMIFFPHKRRNIFRHMAFVVAMIALTMGVFLAGVRVGVQNASIINNTAPLLTVELISTER